MKHIQKTGLRAGQWVTCNAQKECRNGGSHYASKEIEYAKEYFQDKGELEGKQPTASQLKQFIETFGEDTLKYRLSKIPNERRGGISYNFEKTTKRNRFTGETKLVRRDAIIGPMLKLFKEAEDNDLQVVVHYERDNRIVQEIVTPETLESLKTQYGKVPATRRMNDVAKIQIFGDKIKAKEVALKYTERLDKTLN